MGKRKDSASSRVVLAAACGSRRAPRPSRCSLRVRGRFSVVPAPMPSCSCSILLAVLQLTCPSGASLRFLAVTEGGSHLWEEQGVSTVLLLGWRLGGDGHGSAAAV